VDKTERGRIQGLPYFWIPPIILGTGKAKNFKFCTHIHSIARKKNPLKISGKVTVGVLMDSRKFSGHAPIYRAHRAVIFAIAQLSCSHRLEYFEKLKVPAHIDPNTGDLVQREHPQN